MAFIYFSWCTRYEKTPKIDDNKINYLLTN